MNGLSVFWMTKNYYCVYLDKKRQQQKPISYHDYEITLINNTVMFPPRDMIKGSMDSVNVVFCPVEVELYGMLPVNN